MNVSAHIHHKICIWFASDLNFRGSYKTLWVSTMLCVKDSTFSGVYKGSRQRGQQLWQVSKGAASSLCCLEPVAPWNDLITMREAMKITQLLRERKY